MSKQTEAKQAQGYRTDPQNCGNCKHRTCERKLPAWMERSNNNSLCTEFYKLERDGIEHLQRCGIGGFAIKKTATCDKWELAA